MHVVEKAHKQKTSVLIACILITALPLYYGVWQYRTAKHRREEGLAASPWSDDFVDQWLDTQILEPFDPQPLRRYCNATKWQSNVVWRLADANGGVGNVRGNYLDFLWQAIEAGASIILPERATRDVNNLANVWGGTAPFNTFFDEKWFRESMKEACPQMTIYNSTDIPDIVVIDEQYRPPSRRTYADPTWTKSAMMQGFDTWLEGRPGYQADKRMRVDVGRTLWEHDTRALPLGVRRVVGQLLRVTPAVRRVAAMVIQEMGREHHLLIDPRAQIPWSQFFGAHLRTESDAIQAGWLDAPNTNFSAQTDAYMAQAVHNKLKVLYVASGSDEELQAFKKKAAAHSPPLNITHKSELLNSTQLAELHKLTWDQQALVDYEVLIRCSVFGGFVRSSFSYNIAITRSQWVDDHAYAVDPWVVLHSEEGVAFDDGFSRIIGRNDLHEGLIPRGMWP